MELTAEEVERSWKSELPSDPHMRVVIAAQHDALIVSHAELRTSRDQERARAEQAEKEKKQYHANWQMAESDLTWARDRYRQAERERDEARGETLECHSCGYGTNRIEETQCPNDGTRLKVTGWKDKALATAEAYARSQARIAALEARVRLLRDGLKECADPMEGWPETWIADAFEESLALVPDEPKAGGPT